MSILEFAMKMELDGKAYYEKLAAETRADGLRAIFTELAQDEQKHYDIFEKMLGREKIGSMTDSTALEGARNIFSEMQTERSELKELKSNLEAYRHAMQAEQKSIDLYREAAEKEPDEKLRSLLMQIVVEEQKHLNILENVYEFVNAPDCPLVWGEWSNLDDI